MDGAIGKLTIAGLKEVSGFVDSVRSDLMGEIDDAGFWVNREDRTFHACHEPISIAEIGQQRDEPRRVRHATTPRSESPPPRYSTILAVS